MWPAETRPRVEHKPVPGSNDRVGYFGVETGVPVIAPAGSIAVFSSVSFHRSGPKMTNGMMCGRFRDPVPQGYSPVEWNAQGDAHATSIVYRAPVSVHRSVGTDVTSKVVMEADRFRRTFRDVLLFAPVLAWAEIWFRERAGTIFHDPLAAATVFEEQLCTFSRGTVSIHVEEGPMQGNTAWRPSGAESPHEVAVDVDAEAFSRHYLSVVKTESTQS